MNNLKIYKTKEQNKALHRTSHKVRRPLNRDVRGGIIYEWCRVTEKGWREDQAMKI